MSKILVFILISLFFTSCSLNKNSKLWNKEDQIVNEVKDQKETIFVEEKKELKELNPLLQLDLSKTKTNNKIYDDLNNFGSLKYSGSLIKTAKYNFSKLDNFNQFNYEPLLLNDGLIVFDKKGNIIRFNDNQKIVWTSQHSEPSLI